MERNEIRIKQIVTGMWSGENGTESYSVIGLSEEGIVYRYDVTNCGWVQFAMGVIDVVTAERGSRRR
jgi:hypothetical protein